MKISPYFFANDCIININAKRCSRFCCFSYPDHNCHFYCIGSHEGLHGAQRGGQVELQVDGVMQAPRNGSCYVFARSE